MWAESAALTCLSADGTVGCEARLARYPDDGVGWLWLHLLLPDGAYGYNDDALSLGVAGVTDASATRVEYLVADADARGLMEREQAGEGRQSARILVTARLHPGAHPPRGPGSFPVEVRATLTPWHAPVTRWRGRTETLGDVQATIRTPERTITLAAPGHWHEQSGPRPTFARPFTHLSLRGERTGLIATKAARGDSGYLLRDGALIGIEQISIDPPGPERALRLTLADGGVISGTAIRRHAFSTAVEDGRRPGSAVLLETAAGTLSGHINDWQSEDVHHGPAETGSGNGEQA